MFKAAFHPVHHSDHLLPRAASISYVELSGKLCVHLKSSKSDRQPQDIVLMWRKLWDCSVSMVQTEACRPIPTVWKTVQGKQRDWPLIVAAPGGLSRLISLASHCLPIIPLSEQTRTCLLPHWGTPRHICTTSECVPQEVIHSWIQHLKVKVLNTHRRQHDRKEKKCLALRPIGRKIAWLNWC